jgi:hypothetical protein
MRGRLYTLQAKWNEAQNDFKAATEQAEQENRKLLQAEVYHRWAESLLERITQGETKIGLRSRAIGMLAHAAELYQEAEASLDHAIVSQLLQVARGTSSIPQAG